MRKTQLLALFLLIPAATALLKPKSTNKEAIFESLDTLAEIMTVVQQNAPGKMDGQELVEGAIDGLLGQLDPHSNYYNEDRFQTMKEDQKGSFYGIGIIVGFQNEQLTVISPLDGAPAFTAGIRAGDVIASIDKVVTKDLDFQDAIRLLRGEDGSQVEVTVRRQGFSEPLSFSIRRAEIPSENVRASFMLDQTTGYIALRDFGETAGKEVGEAMQSLESQGMKQLVLDLRGNPGGLLPQAIEVSSLFIPGKKLVVSTQGRLQNSSQEYYSEKTSPVEQVPLIVLIDRGSASASEIVAGAIQDHDRGLIVGVNSWGKGLVQSVFPLSKGSKGLALTTSRYYTPSGRNIQGSYESLEAYYNPGSSEALYFEPPNKETVFKKTRHGRDVMEVRGITPDVYIAHLKTPEVVLDLELRHSAFFNFATAHQEAYGKVDRDFKVDGRVLDAFMEFLKEKDIDVAPLAEHADILKKKLKYQFLYIANPKWSWEFLMKNDHQVGAAMELFTKAAELLDVYNGTVEIRSGYAQELRKYARLKKEDTVGVPMHPE